MSTEAGLTDAQIAALSPAQRRALIERLAQPVADVVPGLGHLRDLRRRRLRVLVVATVGLIPWILVLAVTLPRHYEARHWVATWVGFDVLLVALLATTALLAWHRRQLFILSACATAVVLVCDAWFDIMTAQSGDLRLSLASALLLELPLATLLIEGALRVIRLTARRLWLLPPGVRLWDLRIPV